MEKVNELSNTIDLESTLIRAEALFRKFQRHVEAIDKKQNFPAPRPADSASPASPLQSAPASGTAPASTPDGRNKTAAGGSGSNKGKAAETPQQKVITPELRKLLRKKFEVLPRKTVAQKGDGMPASGNTE